MSFSDDQLTTEGLPAEKASGRVLLLACGALAREILALIRINNWTHMDLQCLPANLHLTPDKIPDAVETAVSEHRADYEKVFVVYADCGTGGSLEKRCDDLGIQMMAGPHCYSFFEGNEVFSSHAETEFAAFYLTDFLVRQFDSFVWKPMGLDRHPQLLEMYFGNYEKLVYLAQTNTPELDRLAEQAAARLGLPYERRFTGYGDLANELVAIT